MKFVELLHKIKAVKIQGAENIAKAGVKALKLTNDPKAIKKLIEARPTEPALRNAIKYAQKHSIKEALEHFEKGDIETAKAGAKIIPNKGIVFTHCHSSSVMDILIEAKNQGKNFAVNNTETRPLMQGRRTSNDMAKHKIENYHFIDSAMRAAIKQSDLVLLGCDAISPDKIINKIGSELVAETAQRYKKPLYICTDSWKFDMESLHGNETPIEYRSDKEVWPKHPKNVQIVNPAFEQIDPKLIKGVISEYGLLTFKEFIKKVKKELSF
jgi:translation initiation factor 2B subunit (eIF-2B alpha/beta/delta family)